jgi:epoxyqueuosine reductase
MSGQQLVTLFEWTEDEFLKRTEGSPIQRIEIDRWQRNIAVALGNALRQGADVRDALLRYAEHPCALVGEHMAWALASTPLLT